MTSAILILKTDFAASGYPEPAAKEIQKAIRLLEDFDLTEEDQESIMEILGRRANEVATFASDLEQTLGKKVTLPGSVDLALSREATRLRRLRDKVAKIQIGEPDEPA